MASDAESTDKTLPAQTAKRVVRAFLVFLAIGVLGTVIYFINKAYGPYSTRNLDGVWQATNDSGTCLKIVKGGWVIQAKDAAPTTGGLVRYSDSRLVFERDGKEYEVEFTPWLNEIMFDGVAYERQ